MNLINTALSGTLAAQAALDATGQNIANVATPGYTRQGALLVSANATRPGTVSAGNGVQVAALIRFSDAYTSQQMWHAGSSLGQYGISQPYFDELEQVMGDDGANVGSGLDAFFSALNAVSVDPTSTPLRQQVLASAQSLAQRFDSLDSVIANQVASIHQQRDSTVDQINGAAAAIADLNKQIAAAGAAGLSMSGLVDARDQKIDALSSLVGLKVMDKPDGSRDVSLAGGQPLVIGARASTLTVQGNADGSQTLSLAFAKETFTLGDAGLGGQLGGLGEYERNVLSPLRQSVHDIAGQFAGAFNAQLQAGYGMSGTPGQPLFVFDPSSASSMLSVATGVQAADLGFSSDPARPGDSSNLLTLIGLQNQSVNVTSIGAVRLADANTQLVGALGTDSAKNQDSRATAQTVRDQSVANWKSVSGVNSDEEAVNLVQYQQMYQANMKVLSVAGSLFDATLSMMG